VEYFLDWAKVAEDEAKHFTLLSKRLGVSLPLFHVHSLICQELGSHFGAYSGMPTPDVVIKLINQYMPDYGNQLLKRPTRSWLE
jgi:hypothetical protein